MKRSLLLISALILAACATTSNTPPPPPPPTTAAKPLFGEHGFDLAGMDTSVRACDDFYQFAVGKWRLTHPLPAQFPRFGRFEEVSERNRAILHTILEEDAAKESPKG